MLVSPHQRKGTVCAAVTTGVLALCALLAWSVLAAAPKESDHAPLAMLHASEMPQNEASIFGLTSVSEVFYRRARNVFSAQAQKPQTAHLIRVPKAGSTAMSVLVRRLAGCVPEGPCCNFPGDPIGSCPKPGLMCPNVVGCTGHNSYMNALYNSSIPSILMLRQPIARSISAYFYPGAHHNSECIGSLDQCFKQYTTSAIWSNIAVKMLTGAAAYDDVQTCESGCKHSLQSALDSLDYATFVGVNEMWELSTLLLYDTFPSLEPRFRDFLLGASSASTSGQHQQHASHEVRRNTNEQYLKFKAVARDQYEMELQQQNSLDLQLYDTAVRLMCTRLRERGLWDEVVATYWEQQTIIPCK